MSMTQQDGAAGNRSVVAPKWLLRCFEGITAISIFTMALLILFDVVLRYVFNSPLRGVYEINGLLLGLLTMSALPLVTEQRSHITVDLIDGLLHGAVRYVTQLIILVFQMVMIGFISWRIYAIGLREWDNGWVTVDLQISRAPLLLFMAFLGALTTTIVLVMIVQFLRRRLPVIPIGGMNTGSDDL